MIAGRDVAGVDALHAALLQGLEFLEAVDVVRREFAVDLDLHGIEAKILVVLDRNEERHLGIRRIEQPLLEIA